MGEPDLEPRYLISKSLVSTMLKQNESVFNKPGFATVIMKNIVIIIVWNKRTQNTPNKKKLRILLQTLMKSFENMMGTQC